MFRIDKRHYNYKVALLENFACLWKAEPQNVTLKSVRPHFQVCPEREFSLSKLLDHGARRCFLEAGNE